MCNAGPGTRRIRPQRTSRLRGAGLGTLNELNQIQAAELGSQDPNTDAIADGFSDANLCARGDGHYQGTKAHS